MRHDVPFDVMIRNEALIRQVMNDVVKRPSARVIFYPSGFSGIELPFTSFEITQRAGAIDSFSVTTPGAEAFWESLEMAPYSGSSQGDRIKFFLSFAGKELQIFEGFPDERRDTWPQPQPVGGAGGGAAEGWTGGQDPVIITGMGLLGLLKFIQGAYYGPLGIEGSEPIPYTGYIDKLILHFLRKAGLHGCVVDGPAFGSSLPYLIEDPLDVNYSDGYQAVTSLAANIHPAGMIFTTPHGQVRIRAKRPGDFAGWIFHYSDVFEEDDPGKARIISFERSWRNTDVVTRVMVIWKEDAAIVEDSGLKSDFGVRSKTANLPLIGNALDALEAADKILEDANRWSVGLAATINPYLQIGSTIKVHPRMGKSGAARSVEVVGRNISVNLSGMEPVIQEILTCRAIEGGQAWA